ncbi:TPA: hypothetical protein DEG21_02975 [Patescibacteria group bacterium]|nr:hypothetical protein [Candidatus Gracilibacteria bacterium]HBY74833.1 hypothetical protein [Candidatus Gracilibacteria bacterium]
MTNIISQQGHTEKDVLGIKSPIITQKTQRKMKRIAEEIITHTQKTQRKMKRIVKENKRLIETTLSILEEVERRREKQKQLQDYI